MFWFSNINIFLTAKNPWKILAISAHDFHPFHIKFIYSINIYFIFIYIYIFILYLFYKQNIEDLCFTAEMNNTY